MARTKPAEQRRADLRFPLPRGFAARLTGARIQALERRGKYLLARLGARPPAYLDRRPGPRLSVGAIRERIAETNVVA